MPIVTPTEEEITAERRRILVQMLGRSPTTAEQEISDLLWERYKLQQQVAADLAGAAAGVTPDQKPKAKR